MHCAELISRKIEKLIQLKEGVLHAKHTPAQLHLQHPCGMARSGVKTWTRSCRLEAKAQFPAVTITGKT